MIYGTEQLYPCVFSFFVYVCVCNFYKVHPFLYTHPLSASKVQLGKDGNEL